MKPGRTINYHYRQCHPLSGIYKTDRSTPDASLRSRSCRFLKTGGASVEGAFHGSFWGQFYMRKYINSSPPPKKKPKKQSLWSVYPTSGSVTLAKSWSFAVDPFQSISHIYTTVHSYFQTSEQSELQKPFCLSDRPASAKVTLPQTTGLLVMCIMCQLILVYYASKLI